MALDSSITEVPQPPSKAMLAMLLASARFELPEAELPEPLARITLRPRAGLKLKVTMLS
jgi:hypothetical protein